MRKISKEEIAKVVYENSHSSDIVGAVVVYEGKDGTVFSKAHERICLNEEYHCAIGYDCRGNKRYGAKYGYNNVLEIHLIHSPALKKRLDQLMENVRAAIITSDDIKTIE